MLVIFENDCLTDDSVVVVDRGDIVAVDDDDKGEIDGIDSGEILAHGGPIDATDVSMIGMENFGADNTDVGCCCVIPLFFLVIPFMYL